MSEGPKFIKHAIFRPDTPAHFMVLKELRHHVVAERLGHRLAESHSALRLQEAGFDLYDPVVYFDRDDVDMAALTKSDKTTTCPLKGHTEYYHVELDGRRLDNAAWSYVEVYDFDERLSDLKHRIAFDASQVQVTELTAAEPGE